MGLHGTWVPWPIYPARIAWGLQKFVDITHMLHPEPYAIMEDPKVASIEPVWVEVEKGDVVFLIPFASISPSPTRRIRHVGSSASSTLQMAVFERPPGLMFPWTVRGSRSGIPLRER